MSTILVRTAGRPFPCEVGDPGLCRYCDQQIIWAITPRGKSIPLEPWGDAPVTESHFAHCNRPAGKTSSRDYRLPAQGVVMSDTIIRRLLLLVHPDKHHGGASEALATEMTRWLLEQRERLALKGKQVR